MKTTLAVLTLVLAVVSTEAGSFSIYAENDVTHKRDYDYTHGTKFSWSQDGWEYYLWQGIYTSKDKEATRVPPGDRPYAGWLAFGVAREYSGEWLHHVSEFSLGVVGPSSLSEQSQTTIHKWRRLSVPAGWDDQLKDEPAIMYRHEVKDVFWLSNARGASLAVVPQGEVVAGTVMDYAGLGCDLMFGLNPDPYLRNQIAVKDFDGGWGAYLFCGVRGRAVVWNMLLDGNMWHDSPSVDKEPFVGDFQFGVCLSTPWFSAVYTDVSRSREFKTQDMAERFGSVRLVFCF